MRKPFTYVVPVALGTLLSACSTTSETVSDASVLHSQSAPPYTDTSVAPSVTSHSVKPASTDIQASPELAARNQEITQLKRELAVNADQLVTLMKQLDEKERLLQELMVQDSNAVLLKEIERLRDERDHLENQYRQLRYENDQLTADIKRLEAIKAQMVASNAARQQDFIELNKNFRTLDSAHFALSKNYRDLALKHAHLKSEYGVLAKQNSQLQSEYDVLQQENLKLGGALSEARAQHQVLWDKIRVQGNVIDTLEKENANLARSGGLISAAEANDPNAPKAPDTASLKAEITRLKAEIDAQNGLISNYQADVEKLQQAYVRQESELGSQMQAVETRYQAAKSLNDRLDRELKSVQSALAEKNKQAEQLQQQLAQTNEQKKQLQQQLAELKESHQKAQQEVLQLKEHAQTQADEKTQLETQVNNLIPFEGAIKSLQSQLKSELVNVRWILPTSANLNDAFELQLNAEVSNAIQGQTYYAELFVDSALNMMSAAEAESNVDDGKISFRWRLSGLNERPNATMNVAVTQSLNYDGQTILRKVYRDSTTVELISTDWLSKYGYWAAAILGGLIVGFGVARISRRSNS